MVMQASTLVIFGATGDLTHRKLIPALFHLFSEGKLPSEFNIVGFARREENREDHLLGLKKSLERFHEDFRIEVWQDFSERLHYIQGDFDKVDHYIKLAEYLKQFDPPGSCTNKIFYMATAPNFFPTIIKNLESSQVYELLGECWKRIIIEKPFGHDLQSARALNELIDSKFDEKEIYRIDHYLAKETVQNILTFRFKDGVLEQYWNSDFIEHIQITAAEDFGVENRGGYYDEAGNLRDFVQNHLLQLLALVVMDSPEDLTTESIRNSRLKALESLKKLSFEEVKQNLVLGQYEGYQSEPKIKPDSKTETFSALKVIVDLEKFRAVPIYLRSGKNLPTRAAYINVFFKPYNDLPEYLTFHIQPKQMIETQPAKTLARSFENVELGDAYEKLLLDIINGDQTFFPRADEVEAAWKFIDPFIKARNFLELHKYKVKSWGPEAADDLLNKDRRTWFDYDET